MPWERRSEDLEPVGGLSGPREEHRVSRTRTVATGTLACPACDAPVLPDRPLAPSDALLCPVCDHLDATRAFLTLGEPTRPTRVVVRVS